MPRPDLRQMLVTQGVVASPSTIGGGMVWTVLERLPDGTIGTAEFRHGHSANMDAFIMDIMKTLQVRDGTVDEDAA
jgi:hypothetical protein